MASDKSNEVLADVCLYGNTRIGAGWLATATIGREVRRFGDGEPVEHRCFTEAVWMAFEALKAAGVTTGLVRVFAPGGERMTKLRIDRHVPNYGNLKWEPAIQYTISAEALIAEAKAEEREPERWDGLS
jgi:hypothetical protein